MAISLEPYLGKRYNIRGTFSCYGQDLCVNLWYKWFHYFGNLGEIVSFWQLNQIRVTVEILLSFHLVKCNLL